MALKKLEQNMLVDLIMSMFFLVSGITGIMLYFQMRRVWFLGWSISQWHTWSSIGLVIIVGLHLLLHFSMIKGHVKNLLKKKK
ncbi:MAG: DUF4405 domain-containing protein [Candidatus Aenigmarchaeota archaeon]|nr:DUF4405 domain-containing protein [Candidatus Aenigmarchaeota archaeon]